MPEHEQWLTALFNDYLAAPAIAVLNLFGITASNPTRPWQTWLVMELLVVALLMVLAAAVRSSLSAEKPGAFQHIFELVYDFLKTQASDVGVEHPEKYAPFFGTLFVFILAMNLIGIIPLFESPTMTVYVPAALAMSTWVYYHVVGVRALGFKYFAHFAGPIAFLAPLMVVIEIISHFARMLSLSVRLYGNMYAGEQLTNVFISLTHLIVPVLFMGLHVFVGILQAYVFALLTMIYVGIGTAHEH
jgi:F-type H+-transporting ATPase subunit a